MKYNNIVKGTFIERPNRFIAYVETDGRQEKVHVKNTGRCRELLQKGVTVYLEKSANPKRKTAYDLVAVEKGGLLVNMDSAAPNLAAGEWLASGGLLAPVKLIKPECTYGNSRFDFYVESGAVKMWLEVKGVTLETQGTALFPDAPSLRALKHVEELIQARKNGYEAGILFVVQMEGIRRFMPNWETQPAFALALERAQEAGVAIYARGCHVTQDSMEISYVIPVVLKPEAPEPEVPKSEAPEPEVPKSEAPEPEAPKSEAPEPEAPKHETQKPEGSIQTAKECGMADEPGICEGENNGKLCDIAPPLLKWYDGHRRVLPWRENPAPYRVWISEIMLQQTRVEAVKPYFERFMEALPGIPELAQVPEDKLLKLWEGLGYYNRARNLQKAAQAIMTEYGGRMPDNREELLKLPGIGSYTAGAVASIAYGRAVPAVDGNVLRVISRYRSDGRDMLNDKVRKSVEEDLLAVMPPDRPGDFNQALMELGAVVCIPNGAPKCGECPWEASCRAHREGRETEFPKKTTKKARSIEKKTILVIQDAMRAAIRKRPAKGMLAGMYEFPSEEGHLSQEEVIALLKAKGLHPLRIRRLPDSRHIFTHKEWDMIGYAVRVDELEPAGGTQEGLLFIEPSLTEKEYPIPSAYAAYTGYLRIRLGNDKFEEKK